MFQFSSLLNKKDAEVGRRWKTLASSESGPAPARERSVSINLAADQCITDRVRRDLDEQMQRLADLLDHVESIDFDREAASTDLLSAGAELSQPAASAEPAPATAETAASSASEQTQKSPHLSNGHCEVILGSGAIAPVPARAMKLSADRPEQNPDRLDSSAIEPFGSKAIAPERPTLKCQTARGLPTQPTQPTQGLVQEFPVPARSPVEPAVGPDQITTKTPDVNSPDSATEIRTAASNPHKTSVMSPEYSLAMNSPGLHILLVDESRQACASLRGAVPGDRVVALTAGPAPFQPAAALRPRRPMRTPSPVPAAAAVPQPPRPAAVASDSQSLTMLAVVGGLLTLATLAYIAFDLANRI